MTAAQTWSSQWLSHAVYSIICASHGEDFRVEWAKPIHLNQPDVQLPGDFDIGVAACAALMHHPNNL